MNVMDGILRQTGGPTVEEGLLSYYQANGATSKKLADAEREFLIAQLVTPGHRQDMWLNYLTGLGVPGDTLTDMWKHYWCGSEGPELLTNPNFSSYSGTPPDLNWDGWLEEQISGNGLFSFSNMAIMVVDTAPNSGWELRFRQQISIEVNEEYIVKGFVYAQSYNNSKVLMALSQATSNVKHTIRTEAEGGYYKFVIRLTIDPLSTNLNVSFHFDDQGDVGDIIGVQRASVRKITHYTL